MGGRFDLLGINQQIELFSLPFPDIILNFRTTFVSRKGEVVSDSKLIALNYLRGWFFVDFLAAIPFDHLYASNLYAGEVRLNWHLEKGLGLIFQRIEIYCVLFSNDPRLVLKFLFALLPLQLLTFAFFNFHQSFSRTSHEILKKVIPAMSCSMK